MYMPQVTGNVSYQVERIEGSIVHVRETYDLTDRNGPGMLMRGGKPVDCEREGIRQASRFVMMTKGQAIELGLIDGAALTSSSRSAD
jgi:hypothetical protein